MIVELFAFWFVTFPVLIASKSEVNFHLILIMLLPKLEHHHQF
jgi:hypothetical protein